MHALMIRHLHGIEGSVLRMRLENTWRPFYICRSIDLNIYDQHPVGVDNAAKINYMSYSILDE